MTNKKNEIVKSATQDNERSFFADIEKILSKGRGKAHIAINNVMVETYWLIGKRIVEQEQQGKDRANYGEQLLVKLSQHLSSTLGKGFSYANLKNFRQFYQTWPDLEIRYALRSELSWTHIRLIMRVDSEKARQYYLNEASEQRWSSRVLERNIAF
ncbi:MAG: DUF1016 N-terminal domain-containing protein [Candidatus Cloacimonetes bacterium]|nr:DUF1016 N-terminal domain-containing protein [Candidatus Cloacimonadota bacterium]